jgi:hypothetical protein
MTEMLPSIPPDKWQAIEALLPPNKRDKVVLAAILFRQTTAYGLRDTAEIFGLSRARVAEWTTLLESDGTLAKVMRALRLEPAGQLSWRRGGQSWMHRHGNAGDVLEYQLQRFAKQLARSAAPKSRKAAAGAAPSGE